jgi:alpha-beta hydrolase superfamily lysophospholipase
MNSKLLIAVMLIFLFPFFTNAEPIGIILEDKTEIFGELSIDNSEANSVLLLHQCNRNLNMWKPLVEELEARGFSILTVDMRGYGRSASETFDIEKHDYEYVTQHFRNDIDEINKYWRQQLPDSRQRVVVGASCGGGLATKSAVMFQDIKALVLFSPSLREHWIDEKYRQKLANRPGLPILGIASESDSNAMMAIESTFAQSQSDLSQKVIYKGDRHGEPLFAHDPELANYISDWIARAVR